MYVAKKVKKAKRFVVSERGNEFVNDDGHIKIYREADLLLINNKLITVWMKNNNKVFNYMDHMKETK